MKLDFTFDKYKELIDAITKSSYKVLTISEYISLSVKPDKFIILRHDVDLDPYYQLQFAEMEAEYGLSTSYYFRYVDNVFVESVIDRVNKLGHEVGYHYEVFTKARGDVNRALKLFKEEQNVFSEKWNAATVCPHGGSFVNETNGYSLKNILQLVPKLFTNQEIISQHVNFDLWEDNEYQDFGIIGDAYKSVSFKDILYLSDTGRSWAQKFKRLDKVESDINLLFNVKSTNDIIDIIKNEKTDKIYILVHFEQWKDNLKDWLSWYIAQLIRRNGKRIIFRNQ